MDEDNPIQRAADKLRSQERMIHYERATMSSPPVEESEAFELAEKLEELDEFLTEQYDNFSDIQEDAPESTADYYTGRFHSYGDVLSYIGGEL